MIYLSGSPLPIVRTIALIPHAVAHTRMIEAPMIDPSDSDKAMIAFVAL
jgi:hypothetical protein